MRTSFRQRPRVQLVCWFFISSFVSETLSLFIDKFNTNWNAASFRPEALIGKRPTPPSNVKLLILPGFGNASSDYTLGHAPGGSLVHSLRNRGWSDEQINVMPCRRIDWLRIFVQGMTDVDFWLAKAPPTQPAFAWYLRKVADSLREIRADEDTKVVLICHSAAGWLARAALGFLSSEPAGGAKQTTIQRDPILGMVTLGAPHRSPPLDVMDVTRGALRITNERFPGAYFADELFYITAIGHAIHGCRGGECKLADFAYGSYKQVCGQGNVGGDGVVPTRAAHLDDALQLDLDGIVHSTFHGMDQWYGADSVLDMWHDHMLREIYQRIEQSNTVTFSSPLDNMFRQ